jgi:hypothetical protein
MAPFCDDESSKFSPGSNGLLANECVVLVGLRWDGCQPPSVPCLWDWALKAYFMAVAASMQGRSMENR